MRLPAYPARFETARTAPWRWRRGGLVEELTGPVLRVAGLAAQVGELCTLHDPGGRVLQHAEVIGFARGCTLLTTYGPLVGVCAGETQVLPSGQVQSVAVGSALLGRVIDSLGEPLDGGPPPACSARRAVLAQAPSPMTRRLIEQPLPTGVRAIDGLTTLGEGQRMGIFAPAGVGKSTLMGMLARGTPCDVIVIALIGERGREVREFIELVLGPEGMRRSVVVCATSDRSAVERAKAAQVATAIAEHFRDEGARVLLMMDSLTRYARALREIGLAAGEMPARRGYPASVFAELPRLLERAGMGEQGSITALYTVLAEDESANDPIAEEVRGILDGHLLLSRRLAARGQYPAIDVLGSLSRVMTQVVDPQHRAAAERLRSLLARHGEIETLLQLGEYQPGNDALADEAVQRIDALRAFLSQETSECVAPDQVLAQLQQAVGP